MTNSLHLLGLQLIELQFAQVKNFSTKSLEQRWRPWPIEDTYIGVLARDVGVSPIDIYGFVLKARASRNLPQFTDCYWDCITALGHRLTPTHLHLVHNKFQNLLYFNSSTCAVNTCGEENGSRSLCVGYIVIFLAAILLAAFAYLRTRRLTLNMQWFCERINIWILTQRMFLGVNLLNDRTSLPTVIFTLFKKKKDCKVNYIFCISKDIRSKKEKKRPHWVHIGLFKLLSQPPPGHPRSWHWVH